MMVESFTMKRADISTAISDIIVSDVPRASAFIVTLYGDVIEPRGGSLGMGALIDCCAQHGLSESLVRTAVSRLSGAGHVLGERIGRKSYYNLTDQAKVEFSRAAQILYNPPPEPNGWFVALGGIPEGRDWVAIGADVAFAPNRSDVQLPETTVMKAETISNAVSFPDFVANHWSLEAVGDAYAEFVRKFHPLGAYLSSKKALDPNDVLALRLRLVHDYRLAALADPRLPKEAYPENWQGVQAREIFLRLYLALTKDADTCIGEMFYDAKGLLPCETPATRRRIDCLRREACVRSIGAGF